MPELLNTEILLFLFSGNIKHFKLDQTFLPKLIFYLCISVLMQDLPEHITFQNLLSDGYLPAAYPFSFNLLCAGFASLGSMVAT